MLPVPAYQLSTGTILVAETEPSAGGVALCARVSSADQRSDPDRQVARPAGLAAREGLGASKVVPELGSGLDGHRAKLDGLSRDPTLSTILVEHRDRLARSKVGYLEAGLAVRAGGLLCSDKRKRPKIWCGTWWRF